MVLCIQLCIVSWRCAKLQRVCHARIAAVPACLLPRKSVQLERGLHDHDVWVVLSCFMPLPLHFSSSCAMHFLSCCFVCVCFSRWCPVDILCMFKGVAPRFVLHPDRFQFILQVNVLFITSVFVMVHAFSADGAQQMSWTCRKAVHQATCQCAVFIQ